MTEVAERKKLCRRILLCGILMLFLIYWIAGVLPPQEVDYSGAEIPLSVEDKITSSDSAVNIQLNESEIVCDSESVSIRNGGAYIRASGAYRLSGTMTDGSLYIAAADGGIVHLILDGVSLSCTSGPTIYVSAAEKIIITTVEETNNTLYTSVSGGLESTVYSDTDIMFNGSGILNITSENGIAVNSTGYACFAEGTYFIKAKENGVKSSYGIALYDGILDLTTGSNALKTALSGKLNGKWLGAVYIEDGALTISSAGDGIDSNSTIYMAGGNVSITCGGGSTESARSSPPGAPEMFGVQASQTSTISTKGLKAETGILISGGLLQIDCADDAINCNGDVTVRSGSLRLLSNGDGIQGDKTVNIEQGYIVVERAYEGISGRQITISGGMTSIVSSDDGINASNSGNPIASLGKLTESELLGTGGRLIITGGELHINAAADGLDANGSIVQTNGRVYIASSSNGVEVPLDYDGSYQMTGGELIAFGSGSHMLQTISEKGSTVQSVVVGASIPAGGTILIVDTNGEVLASEESEITCSSFIYASENLTVGMKITAFVNQKEIGTAVLADNAVQIGTINTDMQPMSGQQKERHGSEHPEGGITPDGMPDGHRGGMSGPGFPYFTVVLVLLSVAVCVAFCIRRGRKRKGRNAE